MGSRTRLVRFDPGVYTTAPFVHDHWEEVYLLKGDLTVGSDDSGRVGEPSGGRLFDPSTPFSRRASAPIKLASMAKPSCSRLRRRDLGGPTLHLDHGRAE
jgi:hypothetical protein